MNQHDPNTPYVTPASPQHGYFQGQPPAPQPPKKKRTLRTVLIIAASVFIGLPVAIGLVGAATGSTGEKAPTAVTTQAAAPTTTAAPTAPATTQAPVAPRTTAAPVAPKTQELSVSQEQAIESAGDYIESGDFSRKSLIAQLKYEDFSTSEATYAADHIAADWTAEADDSAASYLDTGSFSHQGLMDQLLYEGFTKTQAAHGVKSVGL